MDPGPQPAASSADTQRTNTPQSEASPRPVASGSPPPVINIVNNTTVNQGGSAERPPDEGVEFTIDADNATLRIGRDRYVSRNRLAANQAKLTENEPDALATGRLLFDSIVNDDLPIDKEGREVNDGRGRTREGWVLLKQREKLRVDLVLQEDADLYDVRWELLTTDRGEPIGVRRGWTLCRFEQRQSRAPSKRAPLRILVAVCDHPDLGDPNGKNKYLRELTKIDAAEQRQKLEPAFQHLVEAKIAEVTWLNQPGVPLTFDQLRQALRGDFTVVHLFGHGLVLPKHGYRLVLGREDNHTPFVSARELYDILGTEVRLVFLSTCMGSSDEDLNEPEPEMDPNDPEILRKLPRKLGGIARILVDKAPAVIAAQGLLPEDAAGQFALAFYDALGRHGDVANAVTDARLAVNQADAGKGPASWGLFTLHLSTTDAHLFAIDGAKAAKLPAMALPGSSSAEPSAAEIRAALDRAGLDGARLATTLAAARAAEGSEDVVLAQDRALLRAQITATVDISAKLLQEHVEKQKPPLSFDPLVYRQIAAALNAGKHIVLIGPPGTAKTTMAQYVAQYAAGRGMCAGLLSSTATADWTTFDTIGGYVPTANSTLRFRPGVFLRAIARGQWLVLDEMNRAEIDKAIGELFTAIAGQSVELPYEVGDTPVRLLPPANKDLDGWDKGAETGFDYVLHPNWRLIGTMNVYDRASLYSMSLALMRRFAFIDVNIPSEALYGALIDSWGESLPPRALSQTKRLLAPSTRLMMHRTLGPAIARDMLRYMKERAEEGSPEESVDEHLCEALLLYGCSQLDGMDREAAIAVYAELRATLGDSERARDVLARIRSLYPGIGAEEWEPAPPRRRGRGT